MEKSVAYITHESPTLEERSFRDASQGHSNPFLTPQDRRSLNSSAHHSSYAGLSATFSGML